MTDLDRYCQLLRANNDYRYRLEKNTYVVDSLRLMYMDTPKTAGTAIKTRLAELEAGYERGEDSLSLETLPEMFIHDRFLNPLRPITDYSIQEQREMLFSSRWKRICVVRNPYNRLFSAWFSKLLLRQPGFTEVVPEYQLPDKIIQAKDVYRLFEEFVIYLNNYGCNSDPHWDLQTNLLFHSTISWGKIFKFENLQEKLLENIEYFNGKEVTLEMLNVSGFSPDWGCVSNGTIELIRNIYSCDFEHYGYSLSPPISEPGTDTLVAYVNAVSGRNRRLHRLINSHVEDTRRMEVLQGEKQTLQGEKQTLQGEKHSLELSLEDIKSQLGEIESKLKEVTNSRSWKLTGPLRGLLDFIKRILR